MVITIRNIKEVYDITIIPNLKLFLHRMKHSKSKSDVYDVNGYFLINKNTVSCSSNATSIHCTLMAADILNILKTVIYEGVAEYI